MSLLVRLVDDDWDKILSHRGKRSRLFEKSSVSLSDVLRSDGGAFRGNKLNVTNKNISRIDLLQPSLTNRVDHLYLSMNSLLSLHGVQMFVNLKVLSVTDNFIRYFSEISCLRELPTLEMLSLTNNPVTCMPFYREYVLSLCPSLAKLDNVAVKPSEKLKLRESAERAQSYYEILRANELRLCIVEHAHRFILIRQELQNLLMGRFRVGGHLPYRPIDEKLAKPETHLRNNAAGFGSKQKSLQADEYVEGRQRFVGHILSVCMAAGVFRYLQIALIEDFDKLVQELCFKAYDATKHKLRLANAQKQLTTQALNTIDDTPEAKYLLWTIVCDEVVSYQQRRLLRASTDLRHESLSSIAAYHGSSGNTGASYAHASVMSFLQCFWFDPQNIESDERRNMFICGSYPLDCAVDVFYRKFPDRPKKIPPEAEHDDGENDGNDQRPDSPPPPPPPTRPSALLSVGVTGRASSAGVSKGVAASNGKKQGIGNSAHNNNYNLARKENIPKVLKAERGPFRRDKFGGNSDDEADAAAIRYSNDTQSRYDALLASMANPVKQSSKMSKIGNNTSAALRGDSFAVGKSNNPFVPSQQLPAQQLEPNDHSNYTTPMKTPIKSQSQSHHSSRIETPATPIGLLLSGSNRQQGTPMTGSAYKQRATSGISAVHQTLAASFLLEGDSSQLDTSNVGNDMSPKQLLPHQQQQQLHQQRDSDIQRFISSALGSDAGAAAAAAAASSDAYAGDQSSSSSSSTSPSSSGRAAADLLWVEELRQQLLTSNADSLHSSNNNNNNVESISTHLSEIDSVFQSNQSLPLFAPINYSSFKSMNQLREQIELVRTQLNERIQTLVVTYNANIDMKERLKKVKANLLNNVLEPSLNRLEQLKQEIDSIYQENTIGKRLVDETSYLWTQITESEGRVQSLQRSLAESEEAILKLQRETEQEIQLKENISSDLSNSFSDFESLSKQLIIETTQKDNLQRAIEYCNAIDRKYNFQLLKQTIFALRKRVIRQKKIKLFYSKIIQKKNKVLYQKIWSIWKRFTITMKNSTVLLRWKRKRTLLRVFQHISFAYKTANKLQKGNLRLQQRKLQNAIIIWRDSIDKQLQFRSTNRKLVKQFICYRILKQIFSSWKVYYIRCKPLTTSEEVIRMIKSVQFIKERVFSKWKCIWEQRKIELIEFFQKVRLNTTNKLLEKYLMNWTNSLKCVTIFEKNSYLRGLHQLSMNFRNNKRKRRLITRASAHWHSMRIYRVFHRLRELVSRGKMLRLAFKRVRAIAIGHRIVSATTHWKSAYAVRVRQRQRRVVAIEHYFASTMRRVFTAWVVYHQQQQQQQQQRQLLLLSGQLGTDGVNDNNNAHADEYEDEVSRQQYQKALTTDVEAETEGHSCYPSASVAARRASRATADINMRTYLTQSSDSDSDSDRDSDSEIDSDSNTKLVKNRKRRALRVWLTYQRRKSYLSSLAAHLHAVSVRAIQRRVFSNWVMQFLARGLLTKHKKQQQLLLVDCSDASLAALDERKRLLYNDIQAHREAVVDLQLRADYISVQVQTLQADIDLAQAEAKDVDKSNQFLAAEKDALKAQVTDIRKEIQYVNKLCAETNYLKGENLKSLDNISMDLSLLAETEGKELEAELLSNSKEEANHNSKSQLQKATITSAPKLRALKVELLQNVEDIYQQSVNKQTQHLRQKQQIQFATNLANEKLQMATNSVMLSENAIHELHEQKAELETLLNSLSISFENQMNEMLLSVQCFEEEENTLTAQNLQLKYTLANAEEEEALLREELNSLRSQIASKQHKQQQERVLHMSHSEMSAAQLAATALATLSVQQEQQLQDRIAGYQQQYQQITNGNNICGTSNAVNHSFGAALESSYGNYNYNSSGSNPYATPASASATEYLSPVDKENSILDTMDVTSTGIPPATATATAPKSTSNRSSTKCVASSQVTKTSSTIRTGRLPSERAAAAQVTTSSNNRSNSNIRGKGATAVGRGISPAPSAVVSRSSTNSTTSTTKSILAQRPVTPTTKRHSNSSSGNSNIVSNTSSQSKQAKEVKKSVAIVDVNDSVEVDREKIRLLSERIRSRLDTSIPAGK